jgi:hypothetical protein
VFTRTKLPLLFPEHDFHAMHSYPEPGGTFGARERGTGIHEGERASAATRQGKLTVILKIDGSAAVRYWPPLRVAPIQLFLTISQGGVTSRPIDEISSSGCIRFDTAGERSRTRYFGQCSRA